MLTTLIFEKVEPSKDESAFRAIWTCQDCDDSPLSVLDIAESSDFSKLLRCMHVHDTLVSIRLGSSITLEDFANVTEAYAARALKKLTKEVFPHFKCTTSLEAGYILINQEL